MENHVILKNQRLEALIRLPGTAPRGERFDEACMVENIVLDGKHPFGQPEQHIASRPTCWGFGLSGEFKLNGLPEATPKGAQFPKPGVGLLTQIEDGKPHNIWSSYPVERFAKQWEQGEDWIEFTETPIPCQGFAVEIRRRMCLEENQIRLDTTVRNVGGIEAVFSEYQHNFLSIDNLPVDQGYCLELPFDGKLSELPNCFYDLGSETPVTEKMAEVTGQKMYWLKPVIQRTFAKGTERENILDCDRYFWRLSHSQSPAWVTEDALFKPSYLYVWGNEHTICTEVFHEIRVKPGEEHLYTRIWTFGD